MTQGTDSFAFPRLQAPLSLILYVYMYMCVCVYFNIYIYIYIYRPTVCVCVYFYIFISRSLESILPSLFFAGSLSRHTTRPTHGPLPVPGSLRCSSLCLLCSIGLLSSSPIFHPPCAPPVAQHASSYNNIIMIKRMA